jgi:hypothetical protein
MAAQVSTKVSGGQLAQLSSQRFGCPDHQHVELVGGLDPHPGSTTPGHSESPDGLDVAVAGLRDSCGGAREHRTCRGFGVNRIGLAAGPAGTAIWPVNLDHDVPGPAGCAGQSGAVAASFLDIERPHRPRRSLQTIRA